MFSTLSKAIQWLSCYATLFFTISAASAATISWDAGGDGVSTYQEANWTDFDGAPGTDPPANTFNPATDVAADVIVGGTGTAGGSGGASGHFDLADGFSLTVEDDAVFRMGRATASGIRGFGGGSPAEVLTGTDNAQILSQFLLDLDVFMSGQSSLVLYGGGNPLNFTSIELDSSWGGSITFEAELVGDVISEHLSKITVGGAPAVVGNNVALTPDGGSGSVLTVIPEPSSFVLVLACLVALGARSALQKTTSQCCEY